MGFKVSKVIASRHPIPLDVKYYVCTSLDDVDNLPKVDVAGKSGDPISDAPCWYGSEALVSDGTTTTVFVLNADNEWKKV